MSDVTERQWEQAQDTTAGRLNLAELLERLLPPQSVWDDLYHTEINGGCHVETIDWMDRVRDIKAQLQAQPTEQRVTESDAADDEQSELWLRQAQDTEQLAGQWCGYSIRWDVVCGLIKCRVCSPEQEDFDGLCVAHCPGCGYCIHPNSRDRICGICGIFVP